MLDNDDTFDPDRTLERLEKGVSLKLKTKRGSGTRDQDEAYLKIRGETVADVAEQVDDAVAAMKDAIEEQRQIQPDNDAEGEN